MEKKKIELITAWKVYLIVLLWLLSFIGLLIFNANTLQWPPYIFILMGILPLIFPVRLMKRIPWISRATDLFFNQEETVLMIEGKTYPVEKLRWYRLDFNSPLIHQLVLRFEDGQRLRLTVWADGSENEKQLWNLHGHIKAIAIHQKLLFRDYYDRPQLRAISWIVLGTVPVLWTLPLFITSKYWFATLLRIGNMDGYSTLVFRSSAARRTKAEAIKHRRIQQPLPLDPSCRICSALAPAA